MSAPALVVSGPVLTHSRIALDALPKDADVFRSGRFFDENGYPLGRRIGGYFFDDLARDNVDAVARVVREGRYDIARIIRPGAPRDAALMAFEDEQAFKDVLVREEGIANVPALASFLLGQGKPSGTLLMAAWCLAMGYTEVHLLAPGLMARAGLGGDVLSRDVAFLELLQRTFPEARLLDGSKDAELRFWLPASAGPKAEAAREAVRSESRERPLRVSDASDALAEPFELRTNTRTGRMERCAYVTYCDSEAYFWGVRALARSLRRHSQVPLVVMVPEHFVPGGVSLASLGVQLHVVPSISNPHRPKRGHQARFLNTFSKLNVFHLPFLDKAVFLDCDALVLAQLDELFDRDRFAAAPDHGIVLSYDDFNSGLFVCQPSEELFTRMVAEIPHLGSSDGGDQGFLNEFFDRVEWLPRRFNVLKRVDRSLPAMFDLRETAFLHYVGEKPWDVPGSREWDHLDRLWFGFLSDEEQADFLVWAKVQLARKNVGEGAGAQLGRKVDAFWARTRPLLEREELERSLGAFIERNTPADVNGALKSSFAQPLSGQVHIETLQRLVAHRRELARGVSEGARRLLRRAKGR